jgi:kumamolisin
MFGTSLGWYECPDGSLRYRGREHSLYAPTSLKGIIEGVFGLDNRQEATYHAAAHPGPVPLDEQVVERLMHRYAFPEGGGAGQSVAVLEFKGGYDPVLLRETLSKKGAAPQIEEVLLLGAKNDTMNPGGPSLDLAVLGTVVPEARITVYFAPNTTNGWLEALSTAIHDNERKPTVISISWAGDESRLPQQFVYAVDSELAAAAMVGITVCCSSGNDGAVGQHPDGLAVRFPACSPYALSCGGTDCDSMEGPVGEDHAWNRGPGTSTGGGHSRRFKIPEWQVGVFDAAKPGRGVPDVAGHAGVYPVPMNGKLHPLGGTSAVAPLWAGLVVRLNAQLPKPVGCLAPFLYAHREAGAFTDIVRGGNGTFDASPGWDPCTGLGVPVGTRLLELLAAN